MDTKLPPKELELYLAIDELLLNEWDPIGISGIEEAKDEYHAYLPQVFKMVMADATKAEIAKYLNTVVTERIGLQSDLRHSTNIAEKALSLRFRLLTT
jgi:hypothetical protein